MRIVFLGTPQFAIKVLDEINKSRHEIVAVVTQPDKINGRKNKVTFSPVKSYALENSLNVLQFDNISKDGEKTIKSLLPDIMVTCAYGQILRQNILDICPIFNVHASLLPKYRGSSPVQWALINGEEKVGVTIMKTELGVDTGDMILQESIQLVGDENSDETLEKLSLIGAKLIVKALDEFENGSIRYIKQQESEATHCRMLKKEDGKIDFSLSAEKVKNFIRGVTPWPGATTKTEQFGALKVLKAEVCSGSGGEKEGEVVLADPKKGFVVRCGEGYLRLVLVQGENAKAMDAKSYLLGHKVRVGSVMGE